MSLFSPEIVGKNIMKNLKAGLSHKESIEGALENAREAYRKIHPTGNFPMHLQGAGKFYRKNPMLPKYQARKRATLKRRRKKVKAKKNPVRPLKKKSQRKYYLGIVRDKKIHFWINDTRFNTSRIGAASYTSAEVAVKKSRDLEKSLGTYIGVYATKKAK